MPVQAFESARGKADQGRIWGVEVRKWVVFQLDQFSAALCCMMVQMVVQAECGDENGAGNPFNLVLLLERHQVEAISGSACSQCMHHISNLAELLFRPGK